MPATPKPATLRVEFDHIPAKMKATRRWVCWKWTWDQQRNEWTKVPINPRSGTKAKSNDPRTWGSLDDATAMYLADPEGISGIGFMLGDGWVGVDIDNCLDDEGQPSPMAAAIVRHFGTYTEVSPRGKGLKLIGRAVHRLPRGKGANDRKLGLEIYNSARFFTVTGRRFAGEDVVPAMDAIAWLYDEYLPHKKEESAADDPPPVKPPMDRSDEELVDLMLNRAKNAAKVRALWNGQWPAGQSHSEADLALLNHIVFYFGTDHDRIDRIFRQSKLGERGKWTERADYRKASIQKALAGRGPGDFYKPGPRVKMTDGYTADANFQPHESNGHARGSRGAPPVPPEAVAPSPRCGWEIIRDYFACRYGDGYRTGDSVYCNRERREIRRQEACAALPPDLIEPLKEATNAPRFPSQNGQPGEVKAESLPGFFKKWAGTSWAALLQTLPDEDGAEAGKVEVAKDEFRRLVRQALLSEFTLSWNVRDPRTKVVETRIEHRSAVDWCRVFSGKKIVTGWRSVRSKVLWFRHVTDKDGCPRLKVAIRHELFSQLRADRRLIEMESNTFSRRAQRYGVGRPGGQPNRPGGKWALVLTDEFLDDLVASLPDDSESCTGSKVQPGPGEGVQVETEDESTETTVGGEHQKS